MVENAVVKEQLTDDMVDGGAQLVRKLDEMGLSVPAALWLFDPEINEWRLLIASPSVSEAGPQEVYRRIEEARKSLGQEGAQIPLSSIGLLPMNHELVGLLGIAMDTGNSIARIRFSKSSINGHFIDDALIYRSAA